MASHGLPSTILSLVGAITLEIGGGVSRILGFWPRIGAGILVFFLVPATASFHTDFSQKMPVIIFLTHAALKGELLLVTALGGGGYTVRSLDVRNEDVTYA